MRRSTAVGAVFILSGLGVLGTGIALGATATTNTTTHPVTVCVNKLTKIVSAPAGASCPSNAVPISLGSGSDVAALAARIDLVETSATAMNSTVQSQQARIDSLTSQLDALTKRLSADEAALGDPAAIILTASASTFGGQGTHYAVQVSAHGLKPNSPVTSSGIAHGLSGNPVPFSGIEGYATSNGTYSSSYVVACTDTELMDSGRSFFGAPVSSQVLSAGPGC